MSSNDMTSEDGPDGHLDARLIDLESRAMHQEHLVDELNGVLNDHRKLIDRLQRELTRLREQMSSGGGEPGAHDEKPPHY